MAKLPVVYCSLLFTSQPANFVSTSTYFLYLLRKSPQVQPLRLYYKTFLCQRRVLVPTRLVTALRMPRIINGWICANSGATACVLIEGQLRCCYARRSHVTTSAKLEIVQSQVARGRWRRRELRYLPLLCRASLIGRHIQAIGGMPDAACVLEFLFVARIQVIC